MLVNPTSPYQLSLVAFREAKTAYLNFRNYLAQNSEAPEAEQAKYEKAKANLEKAEQDLLAAGKAANESLDDAKVELKKACDAVVAKLQEYGLAVNDSIDKSEESINAALSAFENKFKVDYATTIDAAKSAWNGMKDQLKKGYEPKQ